MALKIQGNGVNYTFPGKSNLRDRNRSVSVPGIEIFGKDGEKRNTDRVRREALMIWIDGVVNSNSNASAKATYDELANAVNSIDSKVYVVNTDDNVRIPCYMTNFEYPREPARVVHYRIGFKALNPYWEDTSFSEVTFTNQKIVDVRIGNSRLYPKITLEGFSSQPTIVSGNWSFCSHVGNLKANAMTDGAGVDPYGEITGQTTNSSIQKSKFGYGRELIGTSITYSSLYQRNDKLSFNFKFSPNWAYNSSSTHYLFHLEKDGTGDNLSLYMKSGKLVFGADSTFGKQMSSFATGDNIEIAGWYDTSGATVDGSNYYGKLFQDGSELGNTVSTISGCDATMDKLFVGSNTQETIFLDGVADEIYLFNQNMGDDWCKGETAAERQLSASNQTYKWQHTLPTNDLLYIDMDIGEVVEYDISANSTSNAVGYMDGKFFSIGESTGKSGHYEEKEETISFGKAETGKIQYRKLYY